MSEESGLGYISMDLNDVDPSDGGFELLPPGEYIFEVKKVTGGTSKAGNPKMSVQMEVIEALDENNDGAVGKSAFQTFVLKKDNDFGRRRLKNFVVACGVEIDSKGGFQADDLVEQQLVAAVRHEDYEEVNALTQLKTSRTTMRVDRERSIDTLDDDAPKSNGKAPKDEEPEPEKKPSKRQSRRRAAPSR